MKIGIVSDSHGQAELLAKAIDLLTDSGAEVLVHCGDIGSPACAMLLGWADVPAYAVLGNVDLSAAELDAAAESSGLKLKWDFITVPLADAGKLAVTHGDQEDLLAELISGGQYAYVCHGHTHCRRDEQVGGVRVINPGSLHCSRDKGPGAALLDTQAGRLEYIDLSS